MTDTAGVLVNTYTSGNGGNVTISAPQIEMTGESLISANSDLSSGNGGTINILDNQSLSIQGTGSQIPNPTGITAESIASGNAGLINIDSVVLSLSGAGLITSASYGSGRGGNVNVKFFSSAALWRKPHQRDIRSYRRRLRSDYGDQLFVPL